MKKWLFLFLLPTLMMGQTTFQQAEAYFKIEQFSKAKPLFLQYLKDHPNHEKTREYLGDIAGHAKDWQLMECSEESRGDEISRYVLGMTFQKIQPLNA